MVARRTISTAERAARLARRHHLAMAARTDDAVRICLDLVALHSTDPATVHLSVAARMAHPSLTAVADSLYTDRSLVRHHAMRRTLWVFTPDVARFAHGAATVALAQREAKVLETAIEANGIAADGAAWVAAARRDTLAALAARGGKATAKQLGEDVPALRQPLLFGEGTKWQSTQAAHTRVLLVMGFEGLIARGSPVGSWISGQYHWSPMSDWVPSGVGGLDVRSAAAGLARHYVWSFGPVTTADLQWWAGWTLGTTRQALDDIGAVEVELAGGGSGWLLPDDLDVVEPVAPWVALLPALDPTTMGWKQRDWYLGPHGTEVFDRNGNGGPTIWADGRIIGAWAQRPDGSIATALLESVPKRTSAAVERSAAALQALLAGTRVSPRFPAPIQKRLLA